MGKRASLSIFVITLILSLFVACGKKPEATSIIATYSGSTEAGTAIDDANSGIEVKEVYSDGSEKMIDDWKIKIPHMLTAGATTTVEIQHGELTTELVIECTTVALKTITPSYTGSTKPGTVINKDDITLTGKYSDGSEKILDNWDMDKEYTLKSGQETAVKIKCDGREVTLKIQADPPSEVEAIYNMATTLTKDKCSKDSLGMYSYNGITFTINDSEWLDNPMNKSGQVTPSAFYVKLAKCLEGFSIGNSWESYSPHILGYTPESREAFGELVDDLSSFIVYDHPGQALLKKFQTVSCVEITGEDKDYDVTITSLSECAEEMGISQEMLGYIIAALNDCGGENIEFNGEVCSFHLYIL